MIRTNVADVTLTTTAGDILATVVVRQDRWGDLERVWVVGLAQWPREWSQQMSIEAVRGAVLDGRIRLEVVS